MQERIQRSRSNAITVMRQLLHHREAEDGLVRSMRQNMDAYETKKKFSLMIGHRSNIPLHKHKSKFDSVISTFDIM